MLRLPESRCMHLISHIVDATPGAISFLFFLFLFLIYTPEHILFVGNLRNDMQEEDFKTFITKRCLSAGVSVVVHSVKLFSKSDNMSARVIISADGAKLVKSHVFWPAPVYCRAWSFDKYQNSDSSLSNC